MCPQMLTFSNVCSSTGYLIFSIFFFFFWYSVELGRGHGSWDMPRGQAPEPRGQAWRGSAHLAHFLIAPRPFACFCIISSWTLLGVHGMSVRAGDRPLCWRLWYISLISFNQAVRCSNPLRSSFFFFPRKENLRGWLPMGMRFLLWVWKCSHVALWWRLRNPANRLLQCRQLCT